jgi:hypothetical protein
VHVIPLPWSPGLFRCLHQLVPYLSPVRRGLFGSRCVCSCYVLAARTVRGRQTEELSDVSRIPGDRPNGHITPEPAKERSLDLVPRQTPGVLGTNETDLIRGEMFSAPVMSPIGWTDGGTGERRNASHDATRSRVRA